MRLVVISGRSGSGKSTALHLLEDLGFNCIDNLPVKLLPAIAAELQQENSIHDRVAVSIDARNQPEQLESFPDILKQLQSANQDCQIIYLDASTPTLIKRFSATRRRHPLSTEQVSLKEALEKERQLLTPITDATQLTIDTTHMNMHELRDLVKKRVAQHEGQGISLLFESFGFKNGVPIDSDLVFDVRCLPNPYWNHALRALSGKDDAVIEFLQEQGSVKEMKTDIEQYLRKWLPMFEDNNRSYMTVAIGCTGGQHRSVYLVESLAKSFNETYNSVQARHRDLS